MNTGPRLTQFYMGLNRENFRNLTVPSHKAYIGLPNFACSPIDWTSTKSAQIIALGSNLASDPGGHKFYLDL